MYDQNYYNQKKQELNQDNLKLIVESYQDIERVVIKAINKARDLQVKFQKVELEEKASQEATKKPLKEEKDGQTAKPAKTGK